MHADRFEVERKFALEDVDRVILWLEERGHTLGDVLRQEDRYYQHPARDFAKTDEALRIRRVDDRGWLTYKGPRLDASTKTRQEIELPIAPGNLSQVQQMLERLGFEAAGKVLKKRRSASLRFQGWPIELSLDQVDALGFFVEIEIVAAAPDVAGAQQALLELSKELHLVESITTSYLELLDEAG